MFKKLFIDSIKNLQWIKYALGFTVLVFSGLLVCYLLTDISSTISIYVLAVNIIVILGNWVSNVMVPRSRLRKGVPDKYIEAAKTYKSKMDPKDFAETYMYAKGLAFSVLALIPIVVIVIFIIL